MTFWIVFTKKTKMTQHYIHPAADLMGKLCLYLKPSSMQCLVITTLRFIRLPNGSSWIFLRGGEREGERERERERECGNGFAWAKVSGTMCVSNGSSKKCKLGAVVVVVEWSACSPYTLMIRVRYPPKSTVFILYIVRLKRLKRGRD